MLQLLIVLIPQRKLMGIQRKQDKENDFSRAQKLLFLWFSVLATLTFAASCGVILLHVMVDHKYWCGQQLVVSLRILLLTIEHDINISG